MEPVPFIKMHGLGNDFVIIDARKRPFALDAAQAAAIADRRRGVGCDQIILLEPPKSPAEDAFMRIRNADGSESGACGNATRCIGAILMQETGKQRINLATKAGELAAMGDSTGMVTIDFGPARLDWREVPLAPDPKGAQDTLHLSLAAGPVSDPAACSLGNPHATFFVPDVTEIDLAALGPGLEFHPIFPERANIGFAQIVSRDEIRLRVWERGAGITQACGTGASAALVNAHRRGLTGRKATVVLDGGPLIIEWRESDSHVLMTGPVAISFRGTLDPSLLTPAPIALA